MIKGTIKGQSLRLSYPTVVSDTVAYLTAEFSFLTDGWNGLDKWAQFCKGEQVYSVRLTDGRITEEDHLDLEAGEWQVSVFGTAIDGETVLRRITTKPYPLVVAQSGALDGEPLPITPPSTGEKILMTAEQALAVAQGVRADADAGAFRGEKGEKGEKGDPTQVFQELGDSPDGVMSQRATTEVVEDVTRRVEKLEYASRGVSYEDVTDEGEAYSVTMPEGILPYGAVSMVGGHSPVRERNLLPMPYNGTVEKSEGDWVDEIYESIASDGTITITGYGEIDHNIHLVVEEDAWYPGQGFFFISGTPTNHDTYLTVKVWKDGENVDGFTDSFGEGAMMDLTDVAYDYLTVELLVGCSDEAIECVVRPQLELGTAATEWEPYALKHAPVTEVVSRGRNIGQFEVTDKYGCTLSQDGNRFTMERDGTGASSYVLMQLDTLTVGEDYTVVIKAEGIPLDETVTSEKAYAAVLNGEGSPLSEATFQNQFVTHMIGTFTAEETVLQIGLSNTRESGAITYSVELLHGAVTAVPSDFRDPWEARLEIPATVTKEHADSWGYSVGDACSYIDFEAGKYHACARVRAYATGDFDDETVLTDGVQTVYPCDEVYDIALPESLLRLEDGGTVCFENAQARSVPYRMQYQVKV